MLIQATTAQNECFERLKQIFGSGSIGFTLIGAAACREYGLSRPAKDLDITVSPYQQAMRMLAVSEFSRNLDSPDSTGRTCTQRHVKTDVSVDFLTGGIYINDGTRPIGRGFYRDELPIPMPTGLGDIASLPTLIGIKTSAAISGIETLKLGANTGGRNRLEIEQDLADVRELISINDPPRNLSLGSSVVEAKYREIYDGLRR